LSARPKPASSSGNRAQAAGLSRELYVQGSEPIAYITVIIKSIEKMSSRLIICKVTILKNFGYGLSSFLLLLSWSLNTQARGLTKGLENVPTFLGIDGSVDNSGLPQEQVRIDTFSYAPPITPIDLKSGNWNHSAEIISTLSTDLQLTTETTLDIEDDYTVTEVSDTISGAAKLEKAGHGTVTLARTDPNGLVSLNFDGAMSGTGGVNQIAPGTAALTGQITDQAIGTTSEYWHTWSSLKPIGQIDASGRAGLCSIWYNGGICLNGAVIGWDNTS
jgi:hypothetical protein